MKRVLTPTSPYQQSCLAGSKGSGGEEAASVFSLAAKEARDLFLYFGEMRIEQPWEPALYNTYCNVYPYGY